MIYHNFTLPYYINLIGNDFRSKIAIIQKTRYRRLMFSYNTILKIIRKTALFFLESGLKKGDYIYIIADNSIYWFFVFLGASSAGLITIPLNPVYPVSYLKRIFKLYKPSIILTDKDMNLDTKYKTIKIDMLLSIVENYDDSLLDKKYNFFIHGYDPVEIIIKEELNQSINKNLIRPVVLTHSNIGSNIYHTALRIELPSGSKFISIKPLWDISEQIIGLLLPLRQGRMVIFPETRKPFHIKDAIFTEKPNYISANPHFLKMFKDILIISYFVNKRLSYTIEDIKNFNVQKNKRDFLKYIKNNLSKSLKNIIAGSCPIDEEDIKFWISIGFKIYKWLGIPEASSIITCTNGNLEDDCGKILDYQNIAITKDNDILASGENVIHYELNKKYFKNDFVNGWINTHIKGEIDKNGELHLKSIYNKQNKENSFNLKKEIINVPDNNSIKDIILIAVSEIYGINKKRIKLNMNLYDDLGFDQWSFFELISKIETILAISIKEDVIDNIKSISDLIKAVTEHSSKMIFEKEIKPTINRFRFNLINEIFSNLIFLIFRIISFLFFRVKSINAKQLYELHENIIFLANHSSHLDAISIMRALPPFLRRKTLVAAANDYFFEKNKLLGFLFKIIINIYPFYRGSRIRTNLTNIGYILDNKRNILIFPEGTRSRNGELSDIKKGAGMIFTSIQAACIPVKVENSFNLLPPDKKFPKQGRVTVKFGNIIRFSEKDSYENITKVIYEKIKEL